jgi:hypothetical protein
MISKSSCNEHSLIIDDVIDLFSIKRCLNFGILLLEKHLRGRLSRNTVNTRESCVSLQKHQNFGPKIKSLPRSVPLHSSSVLSCALIRIHHVTFSSKTLIVSFLFFTLILALKERGKFSVISLYLTSRTNYCGWLLGSVYFLQGFCLSRTNVTIL